MKRFSIIKISSVILATIMLMSLFSCKTTNKVALDDLSSNSSAERISQKNEKSEMITTNSEGILSSDMDKVKYPLGIKPIIKNENENTPFDLILVHTNNVNSSIYSSENSIGYARLSTIIKEGKNLSNNILVLDAGNNTSAIPIVKLTNNSLTPFLLNYIGYDAIAPTMNDYENGVDKVSENNSFKILSANVLDSNDNFVFQPYQIYEFNGFKVCVIGLVAPFTLNDNTFMSDLVVNNAQSFVDTAHKYSDFVIVLGNMSGNNISGFSAKEICQNINGIDLFVDGSSSIPSGTNINGTTIVSAKANMESVGIVDLLIKNNEVASLIPFEITADDVNNPTESKLASKFKIESIPEDNYISAYLEGKENSISSELNRVVGILNNSLDNSDIGKKQTNMSKLICSATTSAIGIDGTMLPASTFKSSLNSGELTYKDILLSLTPNDSVAVIKLSGAKVYSLFEDGYKELPSESDTYILSDLKVVYNRFAKPGERILRVKHNNMNIDKDAIYTIATTKEYATRYGFKIDEIIESKKIHFTDILIEYLNR